MVVVLLFGAAADVVGATARVLADGLAAGGPRPVLVIDGPHFAAARRAGVVADHVLSREAYRARGLPGTWDGYLAQELDRLRRDLHTRHVVTLPETGTERLDPAAVRDLLTPPGRRPRLPARLWHRCTVRLERSVDKVR